MLQAGLAGFLDRLGVLAVQFAEVLLGEDPGLRRGGGLGSFQRADRRAIADDGGMRRGPEQQQTQRPDENEPPRAHVSLPSMSAADRADGGSERSLTTRQGTSVRQRNSTRRFRRFAGADNVVHRGRHGDGYRDR